MNWTNFMKMVAHWPWRVTQRAGEARHLPIGGRHSHTLHGGCASMHGVQRPISQQYQIYPPSSPNIWYSSNWNASPRSWRGWKEIQICKYRRKFGEISVKKWPSRLGEIGGAGGETGGWESEGRSDQVKFFKWFQNGRIWNSYMTESNSVELFNVEFFLAENQTYKVEIPLF